MGREKDWVRAHAMWMAPYLGRRLYHAPSGLPRGLAIQ